MENTDSDILQPLPLEKLLLLANSLKRDWPRFAYYHYFVKNVIRCKEKEPNLAITIYCPEGKHDVGVYVAVSSHSLYLLHTFAFQESRPLLFDCLTTSKQIDWTKRVCITCVHEYFEDTVRNAIDHLSKKIGIKIANNGPSSFYFKSKEACIDVQIDVPDGMELRPLAQSDIPVIHDVWPHEEIKTNPKVSLGFLSKTLYLGKGVGLYSKKENKLISWVMQNEWGGLGNAQTLVEYQRKGYAKIVINALCKQIAEENNWDITLFIVQGNVPSEKMFASLGFERINTETFIVTDIE